VALAATAPQVASLPCGVDLPVGLQAGETVRRPGMAQALTAIVASGRSGFYEGDVGAGLLEIGRGEFVAADLSVDLADWVAPAVVRAWDLDVWTPPPNSQGYLTLAGAWIASQFEMGDRRTGHWAHMLASSAFAAGRDRPAELWEGASASALLEPARLAALASSVDPRRAPLGTVPSADGGTIHLCTIDADHMGVSLTQSNASGYGSLLGVNGIFLHDRGQGFSLEPGHPAEYGPGRRPPHTLSPAMVTNPDGSLHTVLGTMGGDTQPQILLQLLARLVAGQSASAAVDAPRWVLRGTDPDSMGSGFDTWGGDGPGWLWIEDSAPPDWAPALRALGHQVAVLPPFTTAFGHAHAIRVFADHFEGAADPRAVTGSAVGW
jgi:gamma-glutamyltranspeptidase/glutathione hydrolase